MLNREYPYIQRLRDALKDGGTVLVIGSERTRFPSHLQVNPRIVFINRDDPELKHGIVQANAKAILFTRWHDHSSTVRVVKEAKRRNIPILTRTSSTGEITRMLEEALGAIPIQTAQAHSQPATSHPATSEAQPSADIALQQSTPDSSPTTSNGKRAKVASDQWIAWIKEHRAPWTNPTRRVSKAQLASAYEQAKEEGINLPTFNGFYSGFYQFRHRLAANKLVTQSAATLAETGPKISSTTQPVTAHPETVISEAEALSVDEVLKELHTIWERTAVLVEVVEKVAKENRQLRAFKDRYEQLEHVFHSSSASPEALAYGTPNA